MSFREWGKRAMLGMGLLMGGEHIAKAKEPAQKAPAAELVRDIRAKSDKDFADLNLEVKEKEKSEEAEKTDVSGRIKKAVEEIVDLYKPSEERRAVFDAKVEEQIQGALVAAERVNKKPLTSKQAVEAVDIFVASFRAKYAAKHSPGKKSEAGGVQSKDGGAGARSDGNVRETRVEADASGIDPLEYIKDHSYPPTPKNWDDVQFYRISVDGRIKAMVVMGREIKKLEQLDAKANAATIDSLRKQLKELRKDAQDNLGFAPLPIPGE